MVLYCTVKFKGNMKSRSNKLCNPRNFYPKGLIKKNVGYQLSVQKEALKVSTGKKSYVMAYRETRRGGEVLIETVAYFISFF